MDSSIEEKSFSVAGGDFTEAEKKYLIRKGLAWEDSNDEIFDVSTDVEDGNLSSSMNSSFLSRSQQESLLIFEATERLALVKVSKFRKEVPRLDLDDSDYREDDKENVFNDISLTSSSSRIDCENFSVSNIDQMDELCEVTQGDECDVIACTQDISWDDEAQHQTAGEDSMSDSYEIAPCTQEIANNDYLDEDCEFNVVPCTQAFQDSSLNSNVSSVPCSQESITHNSTNSSGKEDLDDTITMMTKLLAEADELEAQEKLNQESDFKHTEPADLSSRSAVSEKSKNKQEIKNTSTDITFKTPLKHSRVKMLQNRKMFTPSPPRSYVDSLLQKGGMKFAPKQVATMPSSSSTPKRAPLANITPGKKPGTPRTPISAKVDSGLRRSALPIGLSPVADYIHSKPPPSTFQRVQGIPKTTTTSNGVANTSFSSTKIPVPPRYSQIQAKTPGSTSKTHAVLKTTTFFSTSTPPKIVLNEKRRFQPSQYSGPPRVKSISGSVQSPNKAEYVAHRHIGSRDDSGNASFVQNTLIQKRFIPGQSRFATPPNDSNSDALLGAEETVSSIPFPTSSFA